MKHYRKHPYGILVKPVQREPYKSSSDPLYELSDNNNKRQRIRYSQIAMLANQNPYEVASYPRHTMLANTASRNKFVKNDSGVYVKVYNGPKRTSKNGLPNDTTTHYAKFTVIQDGTETLGMTYRQPKIKPAFKPVDPHSTDFYGISNCRILVSGQGE